MTRDAPSYRGLRPSSANASAAARACSRKSGTACERILCRCLWQSGLRYRKNVRSLPGVPDIAFAKARLAIFCDGDFWHGNHWQERRAKLAVGSNGAYWIAKIERNIQRDLETRAQLTAMGWSVMRVWESEIRADPDAVARNIGRRLSQLIDPRND